MKGRLYKVKEIKKIDKRMILTAQEPVKEIDCGELIIEKPI